jgi:hypothetical protein
VIFAKSLQASEKRQQRLFQDGQHQNSIRKKLKNTAPAAAATATVRMNGAPGVRAHAVPAENGTIEAKKRLEKSLKGVER